VLLRSADAVAAPDTAARLSIDVADRTARVSGMTLDLLLPAAVVDVREVASACVLAARLTAHALSAARSAIAPAPRRLRLVVSERTVPPQLLGDGPLLTCTAPLRPDAPGSMLLTSTACSPPTSTATCCSACRRSGSLTVDPAAPSATPAVSPAVTPTASAPPTRTASRTPAPPTITPPPTPTQSPSPTIMPPSTPTLSPSPTAPPTPPPTPTAPASCPGDCDGDRVVGIDELVRAIAIASGTLPIEGCTAIDASADGAITIDEIVAAVGALLNGC
jgi:hypothetical protein